MTDTEWPGHTQELTRKTSGVLEHWAAKYDANKITLREFYIVVSALYDTTSGLIDRDTSDLLASIHKELRDGR